MPLSGWRMSSFCSSLLKPLPVLGPVDAVRAGAEDPDAGLRQRHGQVQRRLAAELDDDPFGLFLLHDVEHVLPGQRLEVELVRGVVVRADRLRVAVDHDALDAHLPQGQGGLHAAVVELDALPDAVGAAAQDDHLAPLGDPDLVFLLIGGVVVGGVGLELRRAGVHQFVDRLDAVGRPGGSHGLFRGAAEPAELHVRKAVFLGPLEAAPAGHSGGPEPGLNLSRISRSQRRMSRMWCRNQGSIRLSSWIRSMLIPCSRAA